MKISINKSALKIYNVTESDYIQWCKDNELNPYITENHAKFFTELRNGIIIKDEFTHKIVKNEEETKQK